MKKTKEEFEKDNAYLEIFEALAKSRLEYLQSDKYKEDIKKEAEIINNLYNAMIKHTQASNSRETLDWELVNTSSNVAKNEFGDWVEKVCSEKKQTRLAPALLSYDKGCSYFPSSKFYSSLEKAEEDNKSIDRMPEILWPAILNQDGFYTVPEGEG